MWNESGACRVKGLIVGRRLAFGDPAWGDGDAVLSAAIASRGEEPESRSAPPSPHRRALGLNVLIYFGLRPTSEFADLEPRRNQQGIGGPENLSAAHAVPLGDLIGVETTARRCRGRRGDRRRSYRNGPQLQ